MGESEAEAETATMDEVTGRPRSALLLWVSPCLQQEEGAGPAVVNRGRLGCRCRQVVGGEGHRSCHFRGHKMAAKVDISMNVAARNGYGGFVVDVTVPDGFRL